MNLETIYQKLKEIYPEANELNGNVSQNGIYIALDKVVPAAYQKDTVYFRLIIDSVSFARSSHSIFAFLDELRERSIKAHNIFAGDIFESLSFENLDGNGHYAYVMNFKIDAYRDVVNEIMEDEC